MIGVTSITFGEVLGTICADIQYLSKLTKR